MIKALLFLLSSLASVGLLYVFGPSGMIACVALALGTLVFSMGDTDAGASEDIKRSMGYHTTFLADL